METRKSKDQEITPLQQAKNAIKWIEALPKYPHGRLQLKSENGYCCLGAGCEELGLTYNERYGYSDNFAKEVGLLCPMGTHTRANDKVRITLIKMNDGE